MKWHITVIVTMGLIFSSLGFAQSKHHLKQKSQNHKVQKTVQKTAQKTVHKTDQKLEKNISFNDRVVNGKHQVPGEGIITVENEKPMINLLSLRSDFKDRREKERQRD